MIFCITSTKPQARARFIIVKNTMVEFMNASRSCMSGVANRSIAIDRSIAEAQLVDRAWFCVELTRYQKRTFFNQYSCLLHFMTFSTCDFITGRSRVNKKFSSRSQSKISWPPLLYVNGDPPVKGLKLCMSYSFSRKIRIYQQTKMTKPFKICCCVTTISKFALMNIWDQSSVHTCHLFLVTLKHKI